MKMSLAEKSFWATLLFLMLGVSFLWFLGQHNTTHIPIVREKIISIKPFEKLFAKNTEEFSLELTSKLSTLEEKINNEMDKVFSYGMENIDTYLDWHYSVIGEYTKLGTMATGELANTIEHKLLGSRFQKKLKEANSNISGEYKELAKSYYKSVEKRLLKDVEIDKNRDVLKDVNDEVDGFLALQREKVGVVGLGLGTAMISKMALRFASKSLVKVTTKVALKTATKFATAGAASLTGLACGPAAVVCGVAAGVTTWFGVDYIFVVVDEMQNREKFKKEILEDLRVQKQHLKFEYEKMYAQSFKKMSEELEKSYSEIEIKKTIREQFRK